MSPAVAFDTHVAFNHGEYDPSSAAGQHVLAHELAHVRQQTQGAVSMLPQQGTLEIDPDERLEREAGQTAQEVMQGGKIGVHRMRQSGIHIQRMPDVERLEQAREQASAESDHLNLAEEVSQIKDRLSSVEEAVAGESTLVVSAKQSPRVLSVAYLMPSAERWCRRVSEQSGGSSRSRSRERRRWRRNQNSDRQSLRQRHPNHR
jgi:hypothetical protein